MIKKFFSKKEEAEEKPKDTIKVRPKIVIKQRRASNAPVPNSIANAMSTNSMPREQIADQTNYNEPYAAEERVAEPEAPVENPPAVQEVDTSLFENRISELKEENQALHAKLDLTEKEAASTEEELNLKITQQKSNYAALEDEFLKRKEEIDDLKDQLEELNQDFNVVSDELRELKLTTVAKGELQFVQTELREHKQLRADLETQVETLKKDQARYESMVTELSTHISELKDSLDRSSEEQYEKLMEVKDQEIVRNGEYILDLEKQVKTLQATKNQLKDTVGQKDLIIDQNQEFESQLIDAQEEIVEWKDKYELQSKEKQSLEDKISVQTSDLDGVGEKLSVFESSLEKKDAEILELTNSLNDRNSKVEELNESINEFESKLDTLESEKADFEMKVMESSGSNSALKAKLEENREKLQQSSKELEELSAKNAELHAIKSMLEKSKEEGISSQEGLQTSLDTWKSKAISLDEEKKELAKKLKALENNEALAELEVKHKALVKEHELMQELKLNSDERTTAMEAELLSTKVQLQALVEDETTSHLIDQISDITEVKSALEIELSAAQKQLALLSEDNTSELLKQQVDELSQEIEGLKSELTAKGDEINQINEDQQAAAEDTEELKSLQVEIDDLKKSEKNLQQKIDELEAKAPINEDTADLARLQSEIDELKKSEEELQGKVDELEASIAESNTSEANNSENEELQNEINSLNQKIIALEANNAEVEAENSNLKQQIVEVQNLQHTQVVEEQEAAAVESTSGMLSVNLVMKPDNDEYDLELPLNMTGKEIKAELTEAGLLEEGKSYDLFFPRIDHLLMNKELLSKCDIHEGETLEIIPGGM